VKVCFQADADLNQTILLAAATAGRLLVTHDIRTMPRHFAAFIQSKASPGVVLVPQHLSVADAVEQLLLIWAASDPDDWINRICSLPL
jgi:hypothetical protein